MGLGCLLIAELLIVWDCYCYFVIVLFVYFSGLFAVVYCGVYDWALIVDDVFVGLFCLWI